MALHLIWHSYMNIIVQPFLYYKIASSEIETLKEKIKLLEAEKQILLQVVTNFRK